MSNLKIFCISLTEKHLEKIKKINYIPVGLGNENFSKGWLRDNSGKNISKKISIMVNILFIIGCGKIIL
jgi:hypothetical protein